MTLRDEFRELFSRNPVRLAHIALLAVQILKQYSPGAVGATESALAQLSDLATQARGLGCTDDLTRLVEHLGSELGFVGNTANYYAPENSDLSSVLARRSGIPITLAIVYIDIGRALGFDLRGVGFPGHFLVGQYGDNGQELALIDPFAARLTNRDECLQTLVSGDARAEGGARWPQKQIDAWFAPVSAEQIALRLLENLKQIHLRQAAYGPALTALELQLLVAPASFELRDQHRALLAVIFGRETDPSLH